MTHVDESSRIYSENCYKCWQILLGTKGKTSSYQKESNPEMRNPELEKATRKLGSKQAIGERIIGMNHTQCDNFFDLPPRKNGTEICYRCDSVQWISFFSGCLHLELNPLHSVCR